MNSMSEQQTDIDDVRDDGWDNVQVWQREMCAPDRYPEWANAPLTLQIYAATLRDGIADLRARIIDLETQVAHLRGAMNAQDERERNAAARCGVPYDLHGCDWPDAAAERIAQLEAALRTAIDANSNRHRYTYQQLNEIWSRVRAALNPKQEANPQ